MDPMDPMDPMGLWISDNPGGVCSPLQFHSQSRLLLEVFAAKHYIQRCHLQQDYLDCNIWKYL